MQNYKLTLEYDGSRYRGWQRLGDGENTIQGKLESILTKLDNGRVEVNGSGRTDAGVHALGQVASFCLQTALPSEQVLAYLRRYLPQDIGAVSCEPAPPRFHARLNAVAKTYRYRIWNSEEPCVFLRRQVSEWSGALDLQKMQAAAALLVGTHDFAAFCDNTRGKKSTVRTVYDIAVQRCGRELQLDFRADGFLSHMVRILTGTLLEVGSDKRPVQSISELFTARREAAGFTAPAKGLCLMEVEYEHSDFRQSKML